MTDAGVVAAAQQYARAFGEERGWTIHVHRTVHRALARLLTGLPPGERVSHTELRRRLSGTNLPMRRTAEVLAALDLLDEDREPAPRVWVDRRTRELPDGFAEDLHGWMLWLLEGDKRTRPRELGTLHSYFGAVRPLIEQWAQDRSHLREVTREDIIAAVAEMRGSRYTSALTSLRSLFRYAKKGGRSSPTPMRGIRVGRRPPAPVMPMSDAEVEHVQSTAVPAGECAGHPGRDLGTFLLRVVFSAVGQDQQAMAAVQLAVEGSLASLEAEVGYFFEQGTGPQVRILGEPFTAVAGERLGEQTWPWGPNPWRSAAVDVVADGLVAVADVISDGLHRPSGRVQGEDLLGSFSGQHEY